MTATERTLSDRAALLTAPDEVPLTTEQAAIAAGLSPGTLRKWACYPTENRLLPAAKRGGRNLYRASDVRQWLGAGRSSGAHVGAS